MECTFLSPAPLGMWFPLCKVFTIYVNDCDCQTNQTKDKSYHRHSSSIQPPH